MERNNLDTVWLNVSPAERLFALGSCCLWEMLPQPSAKIGTKVTKMPGAEVAVSDRCQGCETCSERVCFVNITRLSGGVQRSQANAGVAAGAWPCVPRVQ